MQIPFVSFFFPGGNVDRSLTIFSTDSLGERAVSIYTHSWQYVVTTGFLNGSRFRNTYVKLKDAIESYPATRSRRLKCNPSRVIKYIGTNDRDVPRYLDTQRSNRQSNLTNYLRSLVRVAEITTATTFLRFFRKFFSIRPRSKGDRFIQTPIIRQINARDFPRLTFSIYYYRAYATSHAILFPSSVAGKKEGAVPLPHHFRVNRSCTMSKQRCVDISPRATRFKRDLEIFTTTLFERVQSVPNTNCTKLTARNHREA